MSEVKYNAGLVQERAKAFKGFAVMGEKYGLGNIG